MNEIMNYKPAKPDSNSWPDIYSRICNLSDDGHGSKMLRAVSLGERISKPYENDPGFRIRGMMWQQLGNMGNVP